MTASRNERMLALIEQRLNQYTVEETIERLHSYECHGPSVSEFFEYMESPPTTSTQHASYDSNSEILELYIRCTNALQGLTYIGAAFNDEQFSSLDECSEVYGLAA